MTETEYAHFKFYLIIYIIFIDTRLASILFAIVHTAKKKKKEEKTDFDSFEFFFAFHPFT